jgi:hypothetical protein
MLLMHEQLRGGAQLGAALDQGHSARARLPLFVMTAGQTGWDCECAAMRCKRQCAEQFRS